MVNDRHKLPAERIFGNRLREARKRRGWTQAQLSARLAELGAPLDRSMIAKLERGRTKLTALRNVFALALALDVAPLNLIVPLEDDEDVLIEITPGKTGVSVTAPQARGWIRGVELLPATGSYPGTDAQTFVAEMAESELRTRVAALVRAEKHRAGITPLMEAALSSKERVANEQALVDTIVNQLREEGNDGSRDR